MNRGRKTLLVGTAIAPAAVAAITRRDLPDPRRRCWRAIKGRRGTSSPAAVSGVRIATDLFFLQTLFCCLELCGIDGVVRRGRQVLDLGERVQ
jgi:hypothetical protein